jgi:hypothetical protein
MSKAVKRNVSAKRKTAAKRGGNRAGRHVTRLKRSTQAAGKDPARGKSRDPGAR